MGSCGLVVAGVRHESTDHQTSAKMLLARVLGLVVVLVVLLDPAQGQGGFFGGIGNLIRGFVGRPRRPQATRGAGRPAQSVQFFSRLAPVHLQALTMASTWSPGG